MISSNTRRSNHEETRNQELRQKLGLPRVGERILENATGHMWKVIEEKESWHETESGDPMPAIVLRIWETGDEAAPGSGPTRYLKYTPLEEPFGKKWEVVYGK